MESQKCRMTLWDFQDKESAEKKPSRNNEKGTKEF